VLGATVTVTEASFGIQPLADTLRQDLGLRKPIALRANAEDLALVGCLKHTAGPRNRDNDAEIGSKGREELLCKLGRSRKPLALRAELMSLARSRGLLVAVCLLRFAISAKITADRGHGAPRHDQSASDRVSFDDLRHPSDGWDCSLRADRSGPSDSSAGCSSLRSPRHGLLCLRYSRELGGQNRIDEGSL
jgi:hypothetical protein